MANNSENVNVMRGDVSGYAYWAPLGTDYTPEMVKTRTAPTGFLPLGYITSDGIVNSRSADSDAAQDLNGTTVKNIKTGYEETFQQVFMERTAETLKLNFGAANVSTDATTNVQIVKHNSGFNDTGFMILYRFISDETDTEFTYTDMLLRNGNVKEVGDITMAGTALYQLDATVSALPDSDGNNAVEYSATVAKATPAP